VFDRSEQPTEEALAQYLELVLFDNPWPDDDLPSLIVESPREGVVGFMGRIVRPYRYGDRILRGAVATEVMIDPRFRGQGVGSRMMRAFLEGGQDFTIADRANEGFRRRCEACGGEVASWYSWYWTAPLRPFRFGIRQVGWRGLTRLTSPLTFALDALATRTVPGPYRHSPLVGRLEVLDPTTIPRLLPSCLDQRGLYPVYGDAAIAWLFRRLEIKLENLHAATDRCAIRVEPHGVVGWFVSANHPEGVTETVQLVARSEYRDVVLRHLLHHARQSGAIAVRGRFDPLFAAQFIQRREACTLAEPWVVIHTLDDAIAAAFRRGEAFLSRFEAEWWLAT
jgi:GNAT superfamily N-acetyltransferase